MEKICVAIRVRPATKQEAVRGHQWKVVENAISLLNAGGAPVSGHSFAFDTIFGSDAKNIDIYEQHAKDVVLSAVAGFNGTVFAYGQTSSGKTYTMQGSEAEPGITRLAVNEIFRHIQKMTDREFLIRVSYMEIYNEEINDLLAPESRKLHIHENLERGIFVAGLTEEIVDNIEQVIGLLEAGEAQRHFGETNMNLCSSRSHSIFRLVIESRDNSKDGHDGSDCAAVRVSALNLVDLAGSERIAKTGAGGVRLKEGGHINKSLMCLGNVINKLCDGGAKQGGHIPYRDSKLTRILQTALGGNARTAIICTITPDEIHIDETRGTLQFASRAKRVTNCAQVNETLTDAALLKRQKKEIEELLHKLQGSSPQSEDSEKEIRNLRNDLLKYEVERDKLELELQEEKKAQVDRERRIKEQAQKIENLSTMVISSAVDDRDQPPKKGNRRETWCARQFNTDLSGQKGKKSSLEFESPPAFLDNLPVAYRRDRVFGLPPAFGSLIEDEADSWRSPDGMDRSPTPADFGNTADEDTWACLNQGHLKDDFFTTSFQNERQAMSSGASEESSNSVLLEYQLRELQIAHEELQQAFNLKDLKLQQQLKAAIEEANKFKQQAESLTNEKAKLEECLAIQTSSNRSPSPVLTANGEDYYVKKLEELVNEMEVDLENSKQEQSRLRGEVQDLRDQLLTTNTALQKGIQEKIALEHELLLRERINFQMGTQEFGSKFRENDNHATGGSLDYSGSGEEITENESLLKGMMIEGLLGVFFCEPGGKGMNFRDKKEDEVQSDGKSKAKTENVSSVMEDQTKAKLVSGNTQFQTYSWREDVAEVKENLELKHDSMLDQQLAILQNEKERISKVLMEQLITNEEAKEALRAEKLWLAKELQNYMGTLAVQDEVMSAICTEIKEFDTDIRGRDSLC